MKSFKFLTSFVLLSLGVFVFTGCGQQDSFNEPIHGNWEREGKYVVTFKGSSGYFKSLDGGMWLDAKENDNISIGEQCYRNIENIENNVWECEIRIYNSYSPHETLYWEDCSLTLNSDENVITVGSVGQSFTLTRCE